MSRVQHSVTIKVDVDPVEWEAIYDEIASKTAVAQYVAMLVRDSAAAEDGAILGVETQ